MQLRLRIPVPAAPEEPQVGSGGMSGATEGSLSLEFSALVLLTPNSAHVFPDAANRLRLRTDGPGFL